MEADPRRRTEPPCQAARLQIKNDDDAKSTTNPVQVDRSLAVDRLARWAARGTA